MKIFATVCFLLVSSFTVGLEIDNDSGNPVGGGIGYSSILPVSADFIVSNKSELRSALDLSQAGSSIYILDDTEIVIDLNIEPALVLKSGVTLSSGRGLKRGEKQLGRGALLRATFVGINSKPYNTPLIRVNTDYGANPAHIKTRVTGLRIQGPTARANNPDVNGYYNYETTGIHVQGSTLINHVEIDNNEIKNWPYAGVAVYTSGDSPDGVDIHHNHIHDNRRLELEDSKKGHGLGYGIVVDDNDAVIVANHFSNNRHDIAGTGLGRSGYIAKFNVSVGSVDGHSFDMHGCMDKRTNPVCAYGDRAGDTIIIKNNLFFGEDPSKLKKAIVIRGVPENTVDIDFNKFSRMQSQVVEQVVSDSSNQGINFNIGGNNQSNQINDSKWNSPETSVFGELVGDFDGNGIDDYLQRGKCGASGLACWRLQKWVWSGGKTKLLAYYWGNEVEYINTSRNLKSFAGDFNGDGKDDIGYFSRCGSDNHRCWNVHLSNGESFEKARDFGGGAWFNDHWKI